MKDMLPYLKKYTRECILAPLFKMLEASFELLVPIVMAAIIDHGIVAGDKLYILKMTSILVVLAVIGLISSITAQYYSAKAAVGFAKDVRHDLFAHLQRFSFSNIDRLGASTMITRMTSDVNQAQSGVNLTLRLFLRSPFVVFGAMLMAFTIDFRCALIFAGVIAVLLAVVFAIMAVNIPMMRSVQQSLERVLGATRENLTGARVIRAFCKEDAQYAEFVEKNRALNHQQRRAGNISALMNPLTYVILNIAIAYLIYTGALQVSLGVLTQGQIVALYNLMSQILVELIKLAMLIITMNKGAASWKRITEIMAIQPDMETPETSRIAPQGDVAVAFENVSLRYPTARGESLTNISFEAKRGETIGIIGGTGSGKSSLVGLIPRFYDPSEGTVRIGGVDVRAYSEQELRKKVGIVLQNAVLFQGTLRKNLQWGNPDATDADMSEALTAAQAMDVVNRKGGLDAPVEQLGRNLSGGQRQRLTIARTLVRKPDILILDDSASALDQATDMQLRQAIKRLNYAPTVFIVSQRTASILGADQILVLDDGHLVGKGTHEQLLSACPVYREIYDSQFGEEAGA